MQVTELGLGNSANNTRLLKINYEFGELNPTNGTVDASKNTGNIAKQTINFNGLSQAFVQTYEYDALYRLKVAKEKASSTTNWSQNFTYDRYGNRLTHNKEINGNPFTHNSTTHPSISASTNRITSTGYGYDKNGNLITDADGRSFTFDGNNKQIFVSDGSNTVGEYFYDGNGQRVKKKRYVSGVLTETVIFVYSGGKLIEERSTVVPQAPKTKYLTEDHLGTPRVITDGLGQVVSRRDFMPFGEEIGNTVGTRGTSSFKYASNEDNVRQKFTGYQKDEETGLDFAEARMYENRHARFTAVDPLLASGNSANPQTFNRFVYVTNSPMLFTDPTGLFGWVSKNGRMMYDSEVNSQADAERHHGDGATYYEDGHIYSRNGAAWQVLGGGRYTINGVESERRITDQATIRNLPSFEAIEPLTDIDIMARGATFRFYTAAEGIPKGLGNFGIDTVNFAKNAGVGFITPDIPRFQFNSPLAGQYGSAGYAAPAIYTLGRGLGSLLGGGSTASVVPKPSTLAGFGDDIAIIENSANLTPKKGWYDAVVHGTSDGKNFVVNGNTTTPNQLYGRMLQNGYQPGTNIRLISCYSGSCSNGAAQQLSNLSGGKVVAPTGAIEVISPSSFIYSGRRFFVSGSNQEKFRLFTPNQ